MSKWNPEALADWVYETWQKTKGASPEWETMSRIIGIDRMRMLYKQAKDRRDKRKDGVSTQEAQNSGD